MLRKATRIPKRALQPRKTPRQERSQETVTAILTAAARILESRGLEEFNTNAIADLAGVSIGTVYQYFPDKNAIIAALIRDWETKLVEILTSAFADSRGHSLAVGIGSLTDAMLAHHHQRPHLNRILEVEERRLTAGHPPAPQDEQICGLLADFLDAHHRDGSVEAAEDLMVIVQAMTDAALERELKPTAGARRRIQRAMLGYLAFQHN